MYVRTPRAWVWQEDASAKNDLLCPIPGQPDPQPPSPFCPAEFRQDGGLDGLAPLSSTKPLTLWAQQPLPCPAGTCIGLRQGHEGIEVGVRDAERRLRWRAVLSVLSEQQLQRWIATGFSRRE